MDNSSISLSLGRNNPGKWKTPAEWGPVLVFFPSSFSCSLLSAPWDSLLNGFPAIMSFPQALLLREPKLKLNPAAGISCCPPSPELSLQNPHPKLIQAFPKFLCFNKSSVYCISLLLIQLGGHIANLIERC